jgi:hypothetical protein
MPIARLKDGARLFPIHEMHPMIDGYKPAVIKNRKKYVNPGNLGWGIDNIAVNPTMAMKNGIMIKIHRLR